MRRIYTCTICGYEYDERLGDVDNGIDEYTEFEDLPKRWSCPVCGADKSEFEACDIESDEET